ncbi:hypothetical protein Tco_0489478 [Tanacetum coccineum]
MAEQDIPPPTITAMKIPIIRKGEYDIWSIENAPKISVIQTINPMDVIVYGDLEETCTNNRETYYVWRYLEELDLRCMWLCDCQSKEFPFKGHEGNWDLKKTRPVSLDNQRLSATATTVIEKGILLENVDHGRNQGEKKFLLVNNGKAMHQAMNLHRSTGGSRWSRGYTWSNDFDLNQC